jgi:hypothetical protein
LRWALPLLVFYGYCLYDFAHMNESEMRTYDRQIWLLLLVFANVFGGRCGWSLAGRSTHRGGSFVEL